MESLESLPVHVLVPVFLYLLGHVSLCSADKYTAGLDIKALAGAEIPDNGFKRLWLDEDVFGCYVAVREVVAVKM